MIFGKAEARAKLTVWTQLKALSPPDRRRLANENGDSNWLSLLTPTQYAQLFPDYYKKALPDIGRVTSGAGSYSGDVISGGQSSFESWDQHRGPTKRYNRGSAEPSYDESVKSMKPNDPVATLRERLSKETGIYDEPEMGNGRKIVSGVKMPKNINDQSKAALNSVATKHGLDPAAISLVFDMESKWDPTVRGGAGNQFVGLNQTYATTMREAGWNITPEEYRRLPMHTQIEYYGKWLDHYKMADKWKKIGLDVSKLTVPEQAALLQGTQFGPNNLDWVKKAFIDGDKSARVTTSRQARELRGTYVDKMEQYFSGELAQNPATYEEIKEELKKEMDAASRNVNPQMETPGGTQISPSTPEPGLRKGDELKVPPADLNELAKKYYEGLNENQKRTFLKQFEKAGAQKINEWADAANKTAAGVPDGEVPTAVTEDLKKGNERFFKDQGNIKGVNKKLLATLKAASKDLPDGYYVKTVSGKDARSTGTRNHPGGVAVDLKIYDANGKELSYAGFGKGNKIYEQLAQSMYIRGKEMFPEADWLHGGTWISRAAGYGDRMHYQIIDPDQPVRSASHAMKNYSFEKGVNPNFAYARTYMSPEELRAYKETVRGNIEQEKRAKEEMDKASRNVNPDMTAEPVRPGVSPSTPEPGLRHDFKGTEGGMGPGKDQITAPNVESSPSVNDKIQVEPNAVPKKDNMQMTPPDQKPGENIVKEPPPIDLGKDNPIVIQQGTEGLKAPSATPAAPEPKATPVAPEPKQQEAPKPEQNTQPLPKKESNAGANPNNMAKVGVDMSTHSKVVPPSQERAMKQATLNNKDHFGHDSVNELV